MEHYKDIYEFASSAGALEGYVYSRRKSDMHDLDNWIRNLVKQYNGFPNAVREHFQSSLDRTIGRTIQSLVPLFGEEHRTILTLRSLVAGEIPESPDDFREEKVDKAEKYGQ